MCVCDQHLILHVSKWKTRNIVTNNLIENSQLLYIPMTRDGRRTIIAAFLSRRPFGYYFPIASYGTIFVTILSSNGRIEAATSKWVAHGHKVRTTHRCSFYLVFHRRLVCRISLTTAYQFLKNTTNIISLFTDLILHTCILQNLLFIPTVRLESSIGHQNTEN